MYRREQRGLGRPDNRISRSRRILIAAVVALASLSGPVGSTQEMSAGEPPPDRALVRKLQGMIANADFGKTTNLEQYPLPTKKLGPLAVGAEAPSDTVWLNGTTRWINSSCKNDFVQLEAEVRRLSDNFIGRPDHVGTPARCLPNSFCDIEAGVLVGPLQPNGLYKWRVRMFQSNQQVTCDLKRCVCGRTSVRWTPWVEFVPGQIAFTMPQYYADSVAKINEAKVTGGSILSGASDRLAADDGQALTIRRETRNVAPAIEFQIGLQTADIDAVRVSAVTRSNRTCSQRIEVLRIADNQWVSVDVRSVSNSRAAIRSLSAPGDPLQYLFLNAPMRGASIALRMSCETTSRLTHDWSVDQMEVSYSGGVFR